MNEDHAKATGKYNTVIGGRIKVSDCSQVTDGAVCVVPGLREVRGRLRQAPRDRRSRQIPQHARLGPPHGAARVRRQGGGERGQSVRAAAHAPGDRRRVPARGHEGRAGALGASRRTTASRPPSTWRSTTSASRARRVVEGRRGRRDRARRQDADQPERRPHRRRPSGRRDRRRARCSTPGSR